MSHFFSISFFLILLSQYVFALGEDFFKNVGGIYCLFTIEDSSELAKGNYSYMNVSDYPSLKGSKSWHYSMDNISTIIDLGKGNIDSAMLDGVLRSDELQKVANQ